MTAAKLNILAIDTATEACSVALNLHGVVTQRLEIAPNGHSRLVLGMAKTLLQQSELDLKQLDALAVDVGPGSFTGLRIGIGVAQGLGYGAGLKVIPVGSLEALAWAVPHRFVLAAIDARMQQIYYGLYRNPPGNPPDREPQTMIKPALISPQRLVIGDEIIEDRIIGDGDENGIVGVGSGWDRYAPVLLEAANGPVSNGPVSNGPMSNWLAGQYPEAATVSRLACARGLQSAVSPLRLSASYIRNDVATPSAGKRTPKPFAAER